MYGKYFETLKYMMSYGRYSLVLTLKCIISSYFARLSTFQLHNTFLIVTTQKYNL